MMGWYLVKLLVMLPLIGLLIWGSLFLTRKLQSRVNVAQRSKSARLVETSFLAPGVKLAVIEFHGRAILVGSSRHGLVRLAEAELATSPEPAPQDGADL